MNKGLIYIIFGASGTGKTTLIAQLRQLNNRIDIHEKGTTRDLRSYDELELKHVSDDEIEKYDYIYENYGYKYGISKTNIEDSLKFSKHHFIICNDKKTILGIKKDFKDRVRVIFLLFDRLEDTLVEIQKERNIKDDEINLRVEKYRALNQEFLDNRSFFDAIIINKFGAPQLRMYNQAIAIINSEEGSNDNIKDEILSEIKNIKEEIRLIKTDSLPNLINDEVPIQKNFVFIVMAMDPKEPEIPDIHDTIKEACSDVGMLAQRVDEDYKGGVLITPKLLNHIRTAELVVADLTFGRPNVYYEVGFAHAYNKKVILTIKAGHEVHFDLKGYETII